MVREKHDQLCGHVGSPGSPCFDFQPAAEQALVNELQAETVLLLL